MFDLLCRATSLDLDRAFHLRWRSLICSDLGMSRNHTPASAGHVLAHGLMFKFCTSGRSRSLHAPRHGHSRPCGFPELLQEVPLRTCTLTLYRTFAVSRRILSQWTVDFHLRFHWAPTSDVQSYCPAGLTIVVLEAVTFHHYP